MVLFDLTGRSPCSRRTIGLDYDDNVTIEDVFLIPGNCAALPVFHLFMNIKKPAFLGRFFPSIG